MSSFTVIAVVSTLDLSRLLFALLSAVPGILVCGSLLYLLILLGAAVIARPRRSKWRTQESSAAVPQLAVVIPAHDEELVLAATLDSLRRQDYPADAVKVVVIADNCSDTTAAIACEWRAVTLERQNRAERGKGYALEWAFERLLGSSSPTASAEAYIIVDADTQLAPDFLAVVARRLQRDANGKSIAESVVVIQGRYGVLNPGEGWRTALMTAAFDLCNHIRLQGAANLGLSVGLKGNGMAFSRALLQKARWQGRSITEDIDYGLDLLLEHDVSVGYEPKARVWAQMPAGDAPAASQRERWERGRYRLLGQRVPGLLRAGLLRRKLALFVAAVDLMIPPLAELLGLLLLWGAITAVGITVKGLPVWAFWVWLGAGASFVLYVLVGLKAAGANGETFRALLHVPVYVSWKLILYLRRFIGTRFRRNAAGSVTSSSAALQSDGLSADDWIRTERTAVPVAVPPISGTSGRQEDPKR
ncbi:MAG: glycosyltransferase family 2 protein [Armatimonadota bacterium]